MAKKKARNLVIVESPAKAKTISKILGPDFIVKASYGHVRDLPKSGLNVDLETFDVSYETLKDKAKVIADLKRHASKSDVVYLCPDRDREGEFIALSLAELLDLPPEKTHRVTFNEITKRAISEAFNNPGTINQNLVNAQQARRLLDRIVGYKLTSVLWNKILRGLSAGRVQSVAMRLVADRELEILAFSPEEYWTIGGKFDADETFEADLKEINGKKLACSAKDMGGKKLILKDEEMAKVASAGTMAPGNYVVKSYSKKASMDRPYPPFHTSSLQQAAANQLGFDASRTMRVAQQLYEGCGGDKGLITYMRTDSFSVSKDAQNEALETIRGLYGDEFIPDRPNYYRSKKGSQGAHECVRPTVPGLTPDNSGLSGEQKRLYGLIWSRFIASQMASARYDSASCVLEQDGGKKASFRTSGRTMTFPGWTAVYGRGQKDESLPFLEKGQKIILKKATPKQHFTQPPPRYNDASLVKKMEAEGVGRPSTYASIIKVVIDRKYVERIGRGGKAPLKATDVGIAVSESLTGRFSIMETKFTREMEETLDEVEEGRTDHKAVLSDFWSGFQGELDLAMRDMPSTKEGFPTDYKCPKCEAPLVRRLSRFGTFFQCPECEHLMDSDDKGEPREKEARESDPTGIRCDLCGGDVLLGKGRFGPYLFCEGYARKSEKKVGGKKKKVRECQFTMSLNKKMEPRRKFVPVPTDVECEKCGKARMVIRISSRKKNPDAFLGCSRFPKCRAVEQLPEDMRGAGDDAMETFRKNREKDRRDLDVFREFLDRTGGA